MTIRAGMTELIQELRLLCDAAADEFTLGGQTYWQDEHLQSELDKNRTDIRREVLYPRASYSGGSVVYQDYYFRYPNAERLASGAPAWELEDGDGNAIGTADYTVNYEANHIRFGADTTGNTYFLTYRSFNVNRAAAGVWEIKASNVASRFDVRTDNHDLKRSQLKQHYLDMAKQYRKLAGGNFKLMRRVDVTR